MFASNDVPILLVFGQSNAHGHSLAMAPEDRITAPLSHVHTLRQEENLTFTPDRPVWSGYTSAGTNLGETQDDTYCLPGFLANRWQKLCEDHPGEFPDLYIVRISIGAEGVTEKFMWHPDYERVLTPGPLGTAKMALYPLACNIMHAVMEDFRKQGKNPRILALHWLGGEEETDTPPEKLTGLETLYHRIIKGFFEAAGGPFPIRFYTLHCRRRVTAMAGFTDSLDIINRTFHSLAEHYPGSSTVSAAETPFFNDSYPEYGIFEADGGHYSARTQQWFADKAFDEILAQM